MLNDSFFVQVCKFVCYIRGLNNYLIGSFLEWLYFFRDSFLRCKVWN